MGRSRIVERRPDHVTLEADMRVAGYVVLLDGFAEGWHATLDGVSVPILRANAVFRAVAASAGRHVIEMS